MAKFTLYLSDEVNDRIEKNRVKVGMTKNAYITMAVINYMNSYDLSQDFMSVFKSEISKQASQLLINNPDLLSSALSNNKDAG